MNISHPLENSVDSSTAFSVDGQAATPRGLYVRIYENEVPPFADMALQRLYGNLFSSLAYSRVYGGIERASTYVVHDGDSIVDVWLYRHEGRQVRVLNEGILLDRNAVLRFANQIFASYSTVQAIYFHAVQIQRWQSWQLPMPSQRYNCLEDMVLTLPGSAPAYLAGLGKSTRSYIHRYLNKLKRDFPSFCFQMVDAQRIDPQQLLQIIELNRSRMQGKGKVSINDDQNAQCIIRLARAYGFVGIISIDGRICAGTINYRIGSNYFLDVLAHDSAYNDYRVGTLCCYLTISECLARGGREYHFLWGQDEYKSRLGGVQRDLDHLVLYRSRLQMLLSCGTVLNNLFHAWERKARLWMRRIKRESPVWKRAVVWATQGLRSLW